MKNPIILSIVLFLCTSLNPLNAQDGTLRYVVQVNAGRGVPKANIDIVLIETATFQREVFKTDQNGQAIIELTEGRDWIMHVGEMKNYTKLTRSQYGGNGSATVHYDVERWKTLNAKPVNRDKINLKETIQKGISADAVPQRGYSVIEIELQNGKGIKWRNVQVQLTSFKLLESFIAFTDARGVARLYVPNNQHYQVDIDGEIDFDFIDVGKSISNKTTKLFIRKNQL